MTVQAQVSAALEAAFAFHAPASSPTLRDAKLPGSDFQCSDAISAAARAGKPGPELAESIAAELRRSALFSAVTVTGPGFLNLTLSDASVEQAAAAIFDDPRLGVPDVGKGRKAFVDFGGPNIAKPLHVGHLRSFVIGESLRRILSEAGFRTVSDIHLGDWGLQMGMLLMEAGRRWPGLAVPYGVDVETLDGLYRDASAACREDPAALAQARDLTRRLQEGEPPLVAAWSRMREASLASVREACSTLGAHFDLFLGESDVNGDIGPMVDALLAFGIARESDGAVVADVSEGEPPLILRKSDGAALYGSTDLATLRRRAEAGASLAVYVVDSRQSQHLEAVFSVARRAGYAEGMELVHAGFGTVNGPDRKPYRTRDGGTARLDALVAEAVAKAHSRLETGGLSGQEAACAVGVGALKFADLSSDRLTGYVFDAERMTAFEGRTGPYLQYACARISAIAEKAAEAGIVPAGKVACGHPAERALLLECLLYPGSVEAAVRRLQPCEVAERAFRTAQAFSRFYRECPVIGGGADARPRLALCLLAGRVLGRCLHLLGIDVPKRM